MIALYFHLHPQCKYELFHINLTSSHCTGRYELNELTSLPVCGFIAQANQRTKFNMKRHGANACDSSGINLWFTLTHIDGGVGLLPGFCYTRRLARLAAGDKNPGNKTPPVYVCKGKRGLSAFVIKLFFVLKKCGDQYRKRWLLQIFRKMFLKCFMVRSMRIKGSDHQG